MPWRRCDMKAGGTTERNRVWGGTQEDVRSGMRERRTRTKYAGKCHTEPQLYAHFRMFLGTRGVRELAPLGTRVCRAGTLSSLHVCLSLCFLVCFSPLIPDQGKINSEEKAQAPSEQPSGSRWLQKNQFY